MRSHHPINFLLLLLSYFTSHSNGQWYKKKMSAKKLCVSKQFDLYMLLETSAFVGSGNMVYLRKYLNSIVDGIDVKTTHISIVTFDSKISERLSLKDGSSKEKVVGVVNQLQASGYGVSARKTMRYTADKLFSSEFGRRDGLPAVCLLFVAYPFLEDYQAAATHLKSKCRLAIVGAKYARIIQMFQVASEPSTRHSVFSRRFKDLTRRTESTLEVLCEPPLVSPRITKEGFSADSITIHWRAQPFAAHFLVQLKEASTLELLREETVPSSQSTFIFDNLPPRSNYQIHLSPVGSGGKTGPVGRMVAATGVKAPILTVDNSSISDTSATILMDRTIDGNLKYFGEATPIDDQADMVRVLVSGTSVELVGLEPGTKYSFKITGYRILRTSDTLEEVTPVLFSTGPSSPKVQVVSIEKRSATIKWNTIASATHYKVIVNDVTDNTESVYGDVDETGMILTNLQPSHKYHVYVVAFGNYGLESKRDNGIKIFTGPANPSIISLIEVSGSEVELIWNDVEDTTEYWIFVDEGIEESRKFINRIVTVSNSHRITGLRAGSWYTFTVYSVDEAQTTDENIVHPVQVQTVPQPPSSFYGDSTSSTITIGWEKPQGAERYEVYREERKSAAMKFYKEIFEDEILVEQLQPGEEYLFAFKSISESKRESEMSKIFVFSTLPPASSDVQAVDIWTNGATIQWEAAFRAHGYKVVLLESEKQPEAVIMTKETAAEVNNLESGTFYNVSIYTVGSENRINEYERATVLFQTVAEPPKFVQVSEYGPTSLTVVWEHAIGAHGYRLSVTNIAENEYDQAKEETHLVFGRNEETIHRLNSVTQYRIVIYTINYYNKDSAASTVLLEYTLPETPEQPRVIEVASEMLELDWAKVGGIERYVVHIENKETGKKWELSTAVSDVTIYDLAPGTWYDIYISSVGITGRMNEQGSRLLSTQTLPATPENVRIRQYTTSTISLSWHKVHGVRNYLVTLYDANSDDVTKRISVNGVYATIRSVEPGTEYLIEVSAVGQDYKRFGKPSEALQVFTDPLPPDQPVATMVVSTKIGLKWDTVKGARAYLVEVWSPTFSTEVETNTNEILIENLTPGFLYNFTVFSIGHVRTNNNPSPKLTVYTTPSPPENLRILNIKSETAEVAWDPAEGAGAYLVSVQGLNGIGRNGDIYLKNFTTTRALVDEHLRPGTFYTIFVQTVGISGPVSEKKEFVEFMTLPGNPGNPKLDKVRVYSVTVDWEEAAGAAYYLLNLKRVEDGFVDFIQSDTSAATLRGLQPGTGYELYVEAFNTMDGSSLNVSDVLSFRTSPKGVENFHITSVTDTEIGLAWDLTDGAAHYSVKTSSNGKMIRRNRIDENVFLANQLSPGHTYVFEILPVGSSGELGTLSASVTETTIPTKPTPTIQDHGENFIRIKWDDIKGASTYKVVTNNEAFMAPRVTSTGTSTATITNLTPGSWYSFVIYSIDAKERQSLSGSPPLSAMTSPRQVRNIEFDDVTEDSFDVTWSPSRGAAIYILDVTSPTTSGRNIETNETETAFTGLQSGSDYEMVIRIRDESGRVHKIGSKASISTLPEPVDLIEVESVGTNQVTLKWTPVRGAARYKLETTAPEGARTAETRTEHITLGGLIPGRFYEFAAYSIGVANIANPAPSPTLVVQTAPVSPDPPIFSDVTTTSFTVTWNSVFGSSGYQLTATSSDGSEDIVVNDVISTSYSLETLTAGTEYVVRVVANGQQDGRESLPSPVTTINTVCLTPDKPTIVEVTTSSVTLQWDPVKGAMGYDVDVSRDDGNTSIISTPTSHVTIDSLSTGRHYNFSIYSIGKHQVRNDVGSNPVLVQVAPTAPEEMAFTQIGTTFLMMTWESVGSSSYDVRVIRGDSVVQDLSNRRSPLMVTSLDPGEVYEFGVTAVGDGGYRSGESELAEQATLPIAVDSLTIKGVTDSTISASWSATAGSQSYVLVARSTVDEDDEVRIETIQTNAVLRSLRAGHWYSITIISVGKTSLTNQYATELDRVQTVSLPPGDVEIEQVTTTTIQLSWRQPHVRVNRQYEDQFDLKFRAHWYYFDMLYPEAMYPRVSHYELEVMALDAKFQSSKLQLLRTENDEIVIRNLLPGVSYMTRIVSVNEEGRKSDPTPKIYESTHPASATGLNVIDVNSTSVSINWTPVHGANEYRIFSQDIGTSDQTLLLRTADSVAHISELTPGTKYEFIVFTFDSKNRSSNLGSDVLKVETVPLPPASINVTAITTRDMTLEWNEVKGAAAYKVRYGLMGDNEALEIINTTETSLVISSLQSGCGYWFAIRSRGSNNQLSESSDIITQSTLPATPTSIEVIAASTSLTFYWQPVKGAVRYDGRLVTQQGESLLASSGVANITFSGLDEGTFYNFTATSAGESRSNEEESEVVATQTAPGKPHGLIVIATTTKSVQLDWDDLPGATSYMVVGQNNEGDEGEKEVLTSSANLGGLEPGTAYQFDVQALGYEDVPGTASDPITAVTVPSSPSIVSLESISDTSVTLSWKPTKGAVSYKMVGTQLDGRNPVSVETSHVTSSNLTGLHPGTFYKFAVLARGVNGILNEEEGTSIRRQTVPSPPVSGLVSNITDLSLFIKWKPAVGASSYLVRITSDENEVITSSIEEELEVGDLLPGTQYDIYLQSVGEEGGISEEKYITTEVTYPAAMKDIEAKFVSSTKVSLAWDEVTGATSYQVFVKSKEELISFDEPGRLFVVEDTTVEVDELEPGTYYQFRVFSIGLKERRNEQDAAFIRVQTVTSSPSNLQASNVQTDSAFFTWDKVQGAEKYEIYYELELSDLHNASNIVETITDEIDLNDLLPGNRYWVSVKAVNFQGLLSEGGGPVFITTQPEPVRDLLSSRVTNSSITLSWERPAGSWKFEIKTRNMMTDERTIFVTPSTTYTATQLQPGVEYEFYVTSIGMFDARNSDKNSFVKAQVAPAAPTEVRITGVTNTSIAFQWKESFGTTSYEVTWWTDDDDDVIESRSREKVVESSVTLTSLNPGERYTVTIESYGVDDVIHRHNDETKIQTRTDPPQYLQVFKVTETKIHLKWKPANGAREYIVQIISHEDNENIDTRKAHVSKLLVDNLQSGVKYDIFVRSVDMSGRTSDRDAQLLDIQTVPKPPTSFILMEATTTSIVVSWDPSHGARSYILKYGATSNKNDINMLETSETLASIEQLQPGEEYWIAVKAVGDQPNYLVGRESLEIIETTVPETPTNFRVYEVTKDAVFLDWDTIKGSASYILTVETVNATEMPQRTFETTVSRYQISSLSPGEVYRANVKSVGRNGIVNHNASVDLLIQTGIGAPTNLQTSSVSTSSFNISWDEIYGALMYEVRLTPHDDDSNIQIYETTETNLQVDQLDPGTVYYVTVRGHGFSNALGDISEKLKEATLPLPPSNLVVTHITTDSAFLMWQAQKGVLSYDIHLTAEMNVFEATVITTRTSDVNVTGLLPGTKYLFGVYSIGTATDSHDGVNPISSEVIERQTVCSPPTNLNISNVGASSMIVSWAPSDGAVMYEVEVESEEAELPDKFLLPETQVRLATLVPDTVYHVTIRAVNAENRSSVASEQLQQTTLSSSAKNIRITDYGTTSATLMWDSLEEMDGYKVVMKNIDENEGLMFDVDHNQLVVDSLHPGTLYEIIVFAVEEGEVLEGGSKPTTLLTMPEPPRNFQAEQVSSSTINLSWESAHGADHYEVKYSPTESWGDDEDEIVEFSFSNKLTVPGLDSGREYKFQISTVGRLNDPSAISDELIETTDPLSPAIVSYEELGEDYVVLIWEEQQGAFGYSISYKYEENVDEVFAEKSPYTLSPLEDMTSYEIVVRSVGVRGVIPIGSQVLAVHTVLLSPKNVRVTSVETDSIQLDWDDFKDSNRYQVYYQAKGGEQEFSITTNVSELTINENINSGTTYQFRVTSVDGDGTESSPSEVVEMTTMVHPPTFLEIVEMDTTLANVSWDKVTGATSYRVQMSDEMDEVIMDKIVDDNEVRVDELSPGSKYHIRVGSRDLLSRQSPQWSEILVLVTTPDKPTGAKVDEVSTDSLTLRWNEAQGASMYEVQINTESGDLTIVETEKQFCQINDLLPGEEVTMKITSKSFDKRNEGITSITHRTILPAPTGISAQTLNYTSILLTWSPLERAKSYTIYVSGDSVSSPKKSLTQSFWKIEDITSTSYEVSNLNPATLYSFQLSATNYDQVEGILSSSVSAITGAIELVAPGHSWLVIKWPQVQFASIYTITYTWMDEWDEAQETILEVEARDLVQTDGTVHRNVTDLFPNMNYSFQIRASGHFGQETILEDFAAETLELVPPTNIRAIEVRANHVVVLWDVYQYATSYDVKLIHKKTQKIHFEKNVEVNTVLIDGLTTLDVYMLTIRSVAHGGRSDSSPVLEIQPRHPTPILPLRVAPELVRRSPSNLVVQLQPVEFAASYQVQIHDDSAKLLQTKVIPSSDVAEAVEIGNLKDNFHYKISYFATGFGGEVSGRSGYLSVSTSRLMPKPPQNVELVTKRAGYVVISFDLSQNSLWHSVTVTNRYKGTIQNYSNVTSPYRIASLTVGDAYLIKVNAHSKYGDVIPSEVLSVEIPYPTGGKVRVSRPSRVTSSGFRVQWSPTPYTSSYKLTLAIGSKPMLEVRNVASNQYDFTDLRPSTTYWVKVEAIGRNGIVMSTSSFVRTRTSAEFVKSKGSSLTRGFLDKLELDDGLFVELLEAVVDTSDSEEEPSSLELLLYKIGVEEKILQLHQTYNYSADSSDYNRPLDIKKLNELGSRLKPMVRGEVVKPLSELDDIGQEIADIFMSITELDEVITNDEMEKFNRKLRDNLRELVGLKGMSYVDASEGFGKNRNFAMSFSLVTSHGFRVSWLRFRNSHRYLVILEEQDDDVTMVHNKTYLGLSASFDNLSPDSAYNVTVIPLSPNGLLMMDFSASSVVLTKSRNHKLLAEVTSVGNRHIILSWKVWPTELSGVTFTLTGDGVPTQKRIVTRRASHRVIMFIGLASDTEYQIKAVSTDDEIVYEGIATTKSPTSVSKRVQNDEKKNRVMLPPTNIEVLNSTTHEVKVSWTAPVIEGVSPSDISYSVGLHRPGRLLLVKLIRRTQQTQVIFTEVQSGEYDVRIRSHDGRSAGNQSPYSNPIRILVY